MSYIGLALSEESRDGLLREFRTLGTPIAHHMTVIMEVKTEDLSRKAPVFCAEDIGKNFKLQVTGVARSYGVEAVVVALLKDDGSLISEGIVDVKRTHIPHITVATDGVTKPFKSNELLKNGYQNIENGLILECVLCTVQD